MILYTGVDSSRVVTRCLVFYCTTSHITPEWIDCLLTYDSTRRLAGSIRLVTDSKGLFHYLSNDPSRLHSTSLEEMKYLQGEGREQERKLM